MFTIAKVTLKPFQSSASDTVVCQLYQLYHMIHSIEGLWEPKYIFVIFMNVTINSI